MGFAATLGGACGLLRRRFGRRGTSLDSARRELSIGAGGVENGCRNLKRSLRREREFFLERESRERESFEL